MWKIIPVVAVCGLTCTPAQAIDLDTLIILNGIQDKLDAMELRRDLEDIARMRAETEAYRAAAESLRRQRAPSMSNPGPSYDLEVYRFGVPESPSAPVRSTQPHRK